MNLIDNERIDLLEDIQNEMEKATELYEIVLMDYIPYPKIDIDSKDLKEKQNAVTFCKNFSKIQLLVNTSFEYLFKANEKMKKFINELYGSAEKLYSFDDFVKEWENDNQNRHI